MSPKLFIWRVRCETCLKSARTLADGEITLSHAKRLAKASAHDMFADAEPLLCEQARTLNYTAFEKAVSYWEQLVDADSADDEATLKEQRREFHASMTLDGMGRLDGWLDPIGFEEFRNALDRIETELFNNDMQLAQSEHNPPEAIIAVAYTLTTTRRCACGNGATRHSNDRRRQNT